MHFVVFCRMENNKKQRYSLLPECAKRPPKASTPWGARGLWCLGVLSVCSESTF